MSPSETVIVKRRAAEDMSFVDAVFRDSTRIGICHTGDRIFLLGDYRKFCYHSKEDMV
jgi:hypothetical protein